MIIIHNNYMAPAFYNYFQPYDNAKGKSVLYLFCEKLLYLAGNIAAQPYT